MMMDGYHFSRTFQFELNMYQFYRTEIDMKRRRILKIKLEKKYLVGWLLVR